MKCICGHENDEGYLTKDFKINVNAFRSIGSACNVKEIATIDYSKIEVNEVTKLFACPKCGTVRIKQE